MALLLNMLHDRIAIVKEATATENGLRIRQPVIREGKGECIDPHSFLVEEFSVDDNTTSVVKVNSGSLPQFIEALKELKGDRREKKRKLVRVTLVTK